MKNKKDKIIVIGAGLSGLYSAFLLQELGHEVIILEARDRVGGRTFTENNVDLGGQWISSLQPKVLKLCTKFNIPIYRQFDDGIIVRYFNQKREELQTKPNIKDQDNTPNAFSPYLELFSQLIKDNNLFTQQIGLDNLSFYDWCKQNISNEMVSDTFNYSFKLLTCVDPKFASMFFWLYFLKSCGGYNALAGIRDSAQEFRIEGGSQTLSQLLAKGLNIIYNAEVVKVKKHNNKYHVTTKDGIVYSGDKIISAIPLQLIPKINWQPSLEKDRLKFYQSLKMGSVSKVVIQYKTAFWRQNGYSAHIVSDTPPIHLCYDGCSNEHNALTIFIVDDSGYTDNEIVNQLAFLLNNELAKFPQKIYRKNWAHDEFSGGCYFCVPPINSISINHKYLTMPYEQIYFVGSETASNWMGYMEGALDSAERVVNQLNKS